MQCGGVLSRAPEQRAGVLREPLPHTAVCFSGGGTRSMVSTVGQLRDWTREFGRAPRMVALDEWRAYVRDRVAEGDRLLTDVLRALDRFVPHLALVQEFETHDLAPSPPFESYYPSVLEFCRSTWRVTSGRTKSRTRCSQPTPRLT